MIQPLRELDLGMATPHRAIRFTKPSARLGQKDMALIPRTSLKSSMSGQDTSADTFRRQVFLRIQPTEEQ
jgi:hypothetical protein